MNNQEKIAQIIDERDRLIKKSRRKVLIGFLLLGLAIPVGLMLAVLWAWLFS